MKNYSKSIVLKIRSEFIFFFSLIFLVLNFCVSCKTLQKQDPNFLGDFPNTEVAKLTAGTVKRTKEEIKPAVFTFVFSPRTNILLIHHKFMGDNIWLSLTEENRVTLINAINKYISGYKEKTLNADNNKKKAFFGAFKTHISWGLIGSVYEASPTLRCEYQLLTKNRPYFILGNKTAQSNDGANCPAMRMAFSPSQCMELLDILNQKKLLKLVDEMQKDFDKYDLAEYDVKAKIEKSAIEHSDDTVANYDEDF